MKKAVCFVLICVVLSTLISCDNPYDSGSGDENIYRDLDKMVSEAYSSLTVEISTSLSEQPLMSHYVISNLTDGKRIDYTVERYSSFEQVNGEFVIPDFYRVTDSGYVVISDGEVIEGGSDEIDLDEIKLPHFSFKEENFESSDLSEEGRFYASVKNPSAFLNESIQCEDMTVEVYFDEFINSMRIQYVSNQGASIIIDYSFIR